MTLIFINYRSSDEPLAATALDEELTRRLGSELVFRDSRSIPPGVDFPPELWAALGSARVLVVVIGGRWFGVAGDGRRAIDDPQDYVRREIAFALRRKIDVLPVLVGPVTLPRADALPPDVAGVVTHQYRQIRLRHSVQDITAIADELQRRVCGKRGAGARHDRRPAPEQPTQIVNNHLYDQVDARYGVFGIANGGQ